MEIIILEKKLNNFEKKIFNNLFREHKLVIDPFGNNQLFLDLNKVKNLQFQSDLLKIIDNEKSKILNNFIVASRVYPHIIEMKISEFNYSDNYWKAYFFREFLKKYLNKKRIDKIIIFSSNDYLLYKALKETYNNKISNHIFILKTFNLFFNISKILLIFINNFFLEFYFSIKIKNKKKTTNKKKLLIANFSRDWSIDGNRYKFVGKNTNKFIILVSILRNNSNILKKNYKKRPRSNYSIIEGYIYWFDLIKIYFSSFFKMLIYFKKVYSILKIVNLEFCKTEILLNYFLIEDTKNKSLKKSLKEYLKYNYKFKKILIPMFEFIEGRIYANFFNKKNFLTHSFQHSVISKAHESRVFTATKFIKSKDINYLPSKIFVEGKYAFNQFKINKLNSIITGAVRLNSNTLKNNNNKKINILYIDELYDSEYLFSILEFFNNKQINYNFYIRPHPVNLDKYKDKILNIVLKNRNIFLDSSNTLEKSINKYKINFSISTSSTAFLDLLRKKKLCFLKKKKKIFINLPNNFIKKKVYN